MFFQRTLKKEIYGIGIGLHSGGKVKIVLKPAPADHGIKFMHINNGRQTLIDATAENENNAIGKWKLEPGGSVVLELSMSQK